MPKDFWKTSGKNWKYYKPEARRKAVLDKIEDTDNLKMPYGKYKGYLFNEIPTDYLKWLLLDSSCKEEWKNEITDALLTRPHESAKTEQKSNTVDEKYIIEELKNIPNVKWSEYCKNHYCILFLKLIPPKTRERIYAHWYPSTGNLFIGQVANKQSKFNKSVFKLVEVLEILQHQTTKVKNEPN